MTVGRRAFNVLDRNRVGRSAIAVGRMAQLAAARDPAMVWRSKHGWVHAGRGSTLVLPEPRGLGTTGWRHLTDEIFCAGLLLRRDDCVVEVGSGVGTETLTLSRHVGPDGLVIAVEAHPDTADTLEHMVRMNGLTNVRVVRAAVTDFCGEVTISDDGPQESQANRIGVPAGVRVDAVTLDDVVDRFDIAEVSLLKMNIEGAEGAALRGATGSLRRTKSAVIGCHDFLYEETGDESFRTMDQVRASLDAAGFEVTRRVDSRPWAAGYLYARRRL
jgi:FkbM family methyltransferase